MARRKPCEFCDDDHWWTEEGADGHQICVEVYPYNNMIGITSFACRLNEETDEMHIELEMNYCPVCGRKLV